jgi:hypothetical protein
MMRTNQQRNNHKRSCQHINRWWQTITKGEFNKLGGAQTCICKVITIRLGGNNGNISTSSQGVVVVVKDYFIIKINCTSQGF